jgi:glyoxylase-like metal-dependent hydrolase (beta-lactamase superfamily II)
VDTGTIRVLSVNEHLFGFYDGRTPQRGRQVESSWVEDGALSLGICAYALVDGAEALVADTGVSVDHGRAIRQTLESRGVTRITVVLSHWHLDHVAGNAAFAGCEIVASARTTEMLETHRQAIEAGTLEGPPAIRPLVMPTRTFDGDHSAMRVGDLEVELLRFDIHSDDATVIQVPSLGILLAGDTVEDTITYLTEPERVPAHVAELDRMHGLEFERIFPSHGSFETIRSGGYGAGLILATRNYLTRLLESTTDPTLRRLSLREFVKLELDQRWIGYFEPYERVHQENRDALAATLPVVDEQARQSPRPGAEG